MHWSVSTDEDWHLFHVATVSDFSDRSYPLLKMLNNINTLNNKLPLELRRKVMSNLDVGEIVDIMSEYGQQLTSDAVNVRSSIAPRLDYASYLQAITGLDSHRLLRAMELCSGYLVGLAATAFFALDVARSVNKIEFSVPRKGPYAQDFVYRLSEMGVTWMGGLDELKDRFDCLLQHTDSCAVSMSSRQVRSLFEQLREEPHWGSVSDRSSSTTWVLAAVDALRQNITEIEGSSVTLHLSRGNAAEPPEVYRSYDDDHDTIRGRALVGSEVVPVIVWVERRGVSEMPTFIRGQRYACKQSFIGSHAAICLHPKMTLARQSFHWGWNSFRHGIDFVPDEQELPFRLRATSHRYFLRNMGFTSVRNPYLKKAAYHSIKDALVIKHVPTGCMDANLSTAYAGATRGFKWVCTHVGVHWDNEDLTYEHLMEVTLRAERDKQVGKPDMDMGLGL